MPPDYPVKTFSPVDVKDRPVYHSGRVTGFTPKLCELCHEPGGLVWSNAVVLLEFHDGCLRKAVRERLNCDGYGKTPSWATWVHTLASVNGCMAHSALGGLLFSDATTPTDEYRLRLWVVSHAPA